MYRRRLRYSPALIDRTAPGATADAARPPWGAPAASRAPDLLTVSVLQLRAEERRPLCCLYMARTPRTPQPKIRARPNPCE